MSGNNPRHLGLRFTQHYLWWQRLNHVTVLPWGFDDSTDDEFAVVEAIKAKGAIGGDSIGALSDAVLAAPIRHSSPPHEITWHANGEWLRKPKLTEPTRQQLEWEEKQRQRQIERERIADKEWREEEERQSAERKRRWVEERDWWQLERLADYLGHYVAHNQPIPDDPPDEIHATFKKLVGDLIRHEGKTCNDLVRYFGLNSETYIKRCMDELAANDNNTSKKGEVA